MSWFARLFGTAPPPPSLAATRLVVGLGNPGPDYVGTRHNAGFMVVDRLAERLGVAMDREAAEAFVAEAAAPPDPEAPAADVPVLALAKPLTFMNRSGRSVAALLARYGLAPEEMLVVYDDLALPLGALRLRGKGSHGGHNGIRSLIQVLGSTEFPRLRVGVGNSFPPGGQVDFVLSPFDDDDHDSLDAALDAATDAALTFARSGLVAAMNRHNRR